MTVKDPICYRVTPADLAAHIFEVQLSFTAQRSTHTLSLPVWIPGSYMVRDFSRHVFGVKLLEVDRAETSSTVQKPQKTTPPKTTTLTLKQTTKNTWQVTGCKPGKAVAIEWLVYAFDVSVRTAWLGFERGFFNPSSLCMRVHGFEQALHSLEIVQSPQLPKNWHVCTALYPSLELAAAPNAQGFGAYEAADYDELIDSPVTIGQGWRCSFDVLGTPHHLFVTGAAPTDFDRKRLAQDTQKICQTVAQFWADNSAAATGSARSRAAGCNSPLNKPYVFMLHATHNSYGGLEHDYSTALICSRKDLPAVPAPKYQALGKALSSPEKSEPPLAGGDYTTLQGLICHEYFHAWCVRRLKPAELVPYDYERENHTELLWFFEGFTSYYDDLLLLRSGLIDTAQYLKLLAKNLNAVLAGKGRWVQSLGQSSLEAWTKYYRPDENSQNLLVSYYAKGAVLAWYLDLKLREVGGSLDAVMQDLWQRHYVKQGQKRGALTRADIEAALLRQGLDNAHCLLAAWVDTPSELPLGELQTLLAKHHVSLSLKPTNELSWPQRLGWRVQPALYAVPKNARAASTEVGAKPQTMGSLIGLQIAALAQGGAAMQAGLYAGDVLCSANGVLLESQAKFHEVLEAANSAKKPSPVQLAVLRDGRQFTLTLQLLRAQQANLLHLEAVAEAVLQPMWAEHAEIDRNGSRRASSKV